MDLIYGMVSMVKDIKQSDREFRNINFQIKYTIQKALLLLKKVSVDDPNISFIIENLNRRVSEAESISKRLDELLNAESIAIQDKIRLSLPFNQTKNEATKVIEAVEKAICDLKQELPEEQKVQVKNGGVKRKISESGVIQQQRSNDNILIQRENRQIDHHIQQIYEMGPTINDDELHFSQSKSNKCSVEFNVEIKGEEEIVKCLETSYPQILKTKKIFSASDSLQISQTDLYTVARLNFQKCYNKIKAITKDIDRISTKAHFHLVIKKANSTKIQMSNQNEQLQAPAVSRSFSKNNSSKKKKDFLQVNNSKQEEQMFFSFPQDDKNELFENLTVLMRKQDEKKVVYRYHMGQWNKIQEQEIEIGNGERLAAFINPQTKQPSMYFELTYGIING